MTTQESINSICSNINDVVHQAGAGIWQDDVTDTWYIAVGAETTLHSYVRGTSIVLAESDRGGPEFEIFESTETRAMELFATRLLCMNARGKRGLPRLIAVPIPLTPGDIAPGFELASDGPLATLTESATGKIYRGDELDLVVFSHYAKLTPQEVREAYAAPKGKPPFFPLT